MNSKRMIELLEDQLKLFSEREKIQLEQLIRQSAQIEKLSVQVGSLTDTVRSLEESLLQKNGDMQKLEGKTRGMSKLLSNKSEKIVCDPVKENPAETHPPVSPKDRGNNNAKRKEHFSLETIVEHVYPDDPAFDKEGYQKNINKMMGQIMPVMDQGMRQWREDELKKVNMQIKKN